MPPQFQLEDLISTIDRSALSEPPVELAQFARYETRRQPECERRRYRRYSLITNVVAVPLDENLCAAGQPFVALSSGMSVGGIRLIHTDPSPSECLFLEIEGQQIQFVLSVLRNRPIGHCYEIAGQFVEADFAKEKRSLSPLASAACNTIADADFTALQDGFPLAGDELVHWAGVVAAAQVLQTELRRRSLPIIRQSAARGAGR
jgi:hypothetical protein